ncbi:hypothetical protein TRFO_21386 [Tritrichomonas foetus]|uniref:Protein kinase domain-containing protein n=1 Tax=Tritrichomonas foetus TaxID=1144522 RepID=A0A1J4KF60_9EUKA|nr:hypothetical protein TRFO_21386 [Tritrichomonas foetus]|eukprot:OHT09666.1 hypothetical protein TRFO_21386 [Tritrichomonas foetus]
MYHRHFKVVIMGNSGVGKTALLQRGIRGTFDSCFIATIGVDFMIKTVEIGGVQYKVQFWDTAGQERFRSISPALFRKADGIILAFSMVDENSISQMDYWIDLTKKVDCNPSFFIVGTKNDLVDDSNSYIANIEQLQKKYKSISEKIWITSSKTGENIEQTFQDIVETVVRNRPDNTDTKPVVVSEEPKYRSSCCFSRQSLEKKPEITKCKLIFRFCGNNPFSLEFEGNTKMQNVFQKVSTIVHFPVSELEFNYSNSKILESSICNTYKDREIDVFHHKNIAFSHKEQVINIDFNTKNTILDARIKLADIFNISFEKLYLYINGEKLEDSTNLYSIKNSPIYVISKDEKFYFELPNGGTYKKRFKNNTPVSSAKSKIAIICGSKADDIEFSIKGKAISDKEKLNALSDKTITVKIHGYTGNKENAYIYSTSSSSINSSQTDSISHSTSSSVSDNSLSERIPPGNPTINEQDLVEIPISRPKSISERFLKISDFVNQEIIIGRGSFGEIRLYKEIKTGIQVAFKKIMKFPDGTAVASILEELDTMNAANHPAVVPFLGFIPPEGKT